MQTLTEIVCESLQHPRCPLLLRSCRVAGGSFSLGYASPFVLVWKHRCPGSKFTPQVRPTKIATMDHWTKCVSSSTPETTREVAQQERVLGIRIRVGHREDNQGKAWRNWRTCDEEGVPTGSKETSRSLFLESLISERKTLRLNEHPTCRVDTTSTHQHLFALSREAVKGSVWVTWSSKVIERRVVGATLTSLSVAKRRRAWEWCKWKQAKGHKWQYPPSASAERPSVLTPPRSSRLPITRALEIMVILPK